MTSLPTLPILAPQPLATEHPLAALDAPVRPAKGTYALVSLGCPKNLVDTERMLGRLRDEGYQQADIERWASTVAALPVGDVFVYFKHEEQGLGPDFARRFIEATKQVMGTSGEVPAEHRADVVRGSLDFDGDDRP